MSVTPAAFAANIKARRIELGFTLRDVEAITDGEISNGYLSQLENGKIKSPSVHIVYTLCVAYAVSMEVALEWLGTPAVMRPPNLCGECGRPLPLNFVIDGDAR